VNEMMSGGQGGVRALGWEVATRMGVHFNEGNDRPKRRFKRTDAGKHEAVKTGVKEKKCLETHRVEQQKLLGG